MNELYADAVRFTEGRREFSRARFQVVMSVGFVTRDRLLLELMDNNVIEWVGGDRYRVVGAA